MLFGRSESGWLVGSSGTVAHFFTPDGHSACHLWTRTTLDIPALPGVGHCHGCTWAVKHGLV
jgi:hypothetical protein